MKRYLRLVALGIVLAIAWYASNQYGVSVESTRELIERAGSLGPLLFIGLYALATVLFVPGAVLTAASGVLFGSLWGTIYTVIGATIGATGAFYVSRYAARDTVQRLFATKFKRLGEYEQKLKRNGFGVVLLLRLIPLFPFNGLNYALGATSVKPRHYVAATLVGIIPGSYAYATAGSAVATLNVWQLVAAVVVLVVLLVLAKLYHARNNKPAATATGSSSKE